MTCPDLPLVSQYSTSLLNGPNPSDPDGDHLTFMQVTYSGLAALLIHHLPLALTLLLPILLPRALQPGGSSSAKRPSAVALTGRMLGAAGLSVTSLLTAVLTSAGLGILRALISGESLLPMWINAPQAVP